MLLFLPQAMASAQSHAALVRAGAEVWARSVPWLRSGARGGGQASRKLAKEKRNREGKNSCLEQRLHQPLPRLSFLPPCHPVCTKPAQAWGNAWWDPFPRPPSSPARLQERWRPRKAGWHHGNGSEQMEGGGPLCLRWHLCKDQGECLALRLAGCWSQATTEVTGGALVCVRSSVRPAGNDHGVKL